MKISIITTFTLFITLLSFGQAPNAFKYQAVVRNAGGTIITNQSIGLRITLFQGSPTGTAIYTETFSPTTNSYGLVNIEIGTGATTDDFSIIDWANGPYFIETAVDLSGGTSYAIMGTSQLLSVPYALHSKSAETVTNLPAEEFYLGQDTLGGIVFYIYRNELGDQHGLIVSKTEGVEVWQTVYSLTGADRTWDGEYNTSVMTNSPAKDWVTNNFPVEWYLPSVDELNILFNNRFHVNSALYNLGETLLANTGTYWSSQESTTNNGWFFYFAQGYANATANSKGDPRNVRAVRKF